MFGFLHRKSKAERAEKRAADAEAARRLGAEIPQGTRGALGRRPMNGVEPGALPPDEH